MSDTRIKPITQSASGLAPGAKPWRSTAAQDVSTTSTDETMTEGGSGIAEATAPSAGKALEAVQKAGEGTASPALTAPTASTINPPS